MATGRKPKKQPSVAEQHEKLRKELLELEGKIDRHARDMQAASHVRVKKDKLDPGYDEEHLTSISADAVLKDLNTLNSKIKEIMAAVKAACAVTTNPDKTPGEAEIEIEGVEGAPYRFMKPSEIEKWENHLQSLIGEWNTKVVREHGTIITNEIISAPKAYPVLEKLRNSLLCAAEILNPRGDGSMRDWEIQQLLTELGVERGAKVTPVEPNIRAHAFDEAVLATKRQSPPPAVPEKPATKPKPPTVADKPVVTQKQRPSVATKPKPPVASKLGAVEAEGMFGHSKEGHSKQPLSVQEELEERLAKRRGPSSPTGR
jgi:hypothetical protein